MTVKLKKSDKVTKNYYKEIFSESDGDKAMVELKKAKDKLDLGVITQEEYDKIKLELLKYIK
jgi:predicted Zn-dependent protease